MSKSDASATQPPTNPPDDRVVGRTTELARLRALVDAARLGDSGSLLISGGAGIGKTTLLEVLAGVQPAAAGTVDPGPGSLGWVPQRPALYERLTIAENLRLFAGLTAGGRLLLNICSRPRATLWCC